MVTLIHRVTGQWLQVQVTNKLATIHNARVNVLVPNRPGIVASRLGGAVAAAHRPCNAGERLT